MDYRWHRTQWILLKPFIHLTFRAHSCLVFLLPLWRFLSSLPFFLQSPESLNTGPQTLLVSPIHINSTNDVIQSDDFIYRLMTPKILHLALDLYSPLQTIPNHTFRTNILPNRHLKCHLSQIDFSIFHLTAIPALVTYFSILVKNFFLLTA